jgi:hypothetical protein
MMNWLFWAIPRQYLNRYLITLWLVLFFLPGALLGVKLTKLGIVVNLLWYDIIFYGWVRVKEKLEGDKE